MSEIDVVLSKINVIKNCLMAIEKATAFEKDPDKVRAMRRLSKKKQKAKDPQAWNAKMAKYNASCQKRMVNELSDAYVRARLVIPSDGSRRKISAKDIPQSLLEAKRVQLMILRSLKNEKHE